MKALPLQRSTLDMSYLDSHFSLVGLFLTPEWGSTSESLTDQPLAKVTDQC